MAIHPDVSGLVVGVDVGGQNLPEYNDDGDVDDTPANTIVKYVEAVSGAEFGVHVRFDTPAFRFAQDSISMAVYVDGQSGSGSETWLSREDLAWGGRRVIKGAIHKTVTGGYEKRPMFFSELSINDGAADKSLLGKLGRLGTIMIKFYKVRIETITPDPPTAPKHVKSRQKYTPDANAREPPAPLLADGNIAEKNLKGRALTHQATLGAPTAHTSPKTKCVRLGEPFAVFEFKYRSHAALRALHVISRSPSPVPLESKDINELTPEEMRELLRRQRENRDRDNAKKIEREIKRERVELSEEESDGGVQLVARQPKKKRGAIPRGEGQVIELSDNE